MLWRKLDFEWCTLPNFLTPVQHCSTLDWGADVSFGNHKHINTFFELCLRSSLRLLLPPHIPIQPLKFAGNMKIMKQRERGVCCFLGLGIVNVRSSDVLSSIENLDLKFLSPKLCTQLLFLRAKVKCTECAKSDLEQFFKV